MYEAYTETWARIINCCFYIVIQKNGNNDRSDREKYRLAPENDHSVKTKKKVGRDRRDSSQEEGGGLEFCGSKTAARMPRLKVPIKTAMT